MGFWVSRSSRDCRAGLRGRRERAGFAVALQILPPNCRITALLQNPQAARRLGFRKSLSHRRRQGGGSTRS